MNENNAAVKATDIVNKMQTVVYRILCDIDDFCNKNNITYYLSGGTCLGAVRHHGFIPWDDDGDIMMPRKDFDRFINLFPNEYSEKYGLGTLETDKEWQRPYARVYDLKTKWTSKLVKEKSMGVLVDIFPIDGTPSTLIGKDVFFAQMHFYNVMRNASVRLSYMPGEKGVPIKKVLSFFAKPFGARFFAMKINKMAKKYDFDSSDYVACSVPVHYGKKELIKREEMASSVLMKFCDRDFPVPVGYDKYLSNLYGDYMKPPENAQKNGYTHLSFWEVDV